MLPSIQFILVSFLSHPRMVKFRETMLFADVVVCLEHDLDSLWILLGFGFWTLWKPVAGSQWHLGGSVFVLEVISFPEFSQLIRECWALEYQWRPASGIWTVRNPQTTQSHKPAQFKQTCLGSLMVNGSTGWVMYQGFVHLDAETQAAERLWSFLLLVNLAPLLKACWRRLHLWHVKYLNIRSCHILPQAKIFLQALLMKLTLTW